MGTTVREGRAVVLDACVLFPAAPRDTLVRSAEAGLYRPRWTIRILEEVRRNLLADRGLTEERARRLVEVMRAHFPDALAPATSTCSTE